MIRRAVWLWAALVLVPSASAFDATWCREVLDAALTAAEVRTQRVTMPDAIEAVRGNATAVYIMRRAYEEIPALDYTQPPASLVRPRLAQEFAERIYADCLTAAQDE